MNNWGENISNDSVGDENFADRFANGKVRWGKDRDMVWEEIDSIIADAPAVSVIRMKPSRLILSAAAVIIVLTGIASVLKFYTRTYVTSPGEHFHLNLPDGSTASLNAGTTLKYHPYWWSFSRAIELNGEAFFEVEKGRQFEVISDAGRTVVLGTSFNVLARDGSYEVTCISGKVLVVASATGDEIIIAPDQKVVLSSLGLFDVDYEADIKEETSWSRGEFYFTAIPLDEVFSEIELQYGIRIDYKTVEELTYTGYFGKEQDVEKVLNLVCIPFGIKFEQLAEGTYRIIQNE